MRRPYDLVVVGLGSGGIVVAQFAAKIGIKVAAIERVRVGGDCLWTGCIPSTALIASARTVRSAAHVGLTPIKPEIDLATVWRRMRAVQAQIARAEGDARLAGPHTVQVAQDTLDTRFVLLCTGSRPTVPAIAGLDEAGFLTNETLFELERPPSSVSIIGGGPIGVELAQAWRRLGLRVTLVERGSQLLPRDEPPLVARLTARLRDEGIDVRLGAAAGEVAVEDGTKTRRLAGGARAVAADELLVAVGRQPGVERLGLQELGIEVADRGIVVDSRLRTAVRSISAAGDVAGRFAFTHSTAHEAAPAVRNMFFPGHEPAAMLVPWCTFTDPELAHVGLTGSQARERFGDARAAVHELALAFRQKLKLRELSSLVHVYPTHSASVSMLAAEAAFTRARRYA